MKWKVSSRCEDFRSIKFCRTLACTHHVKWNYITTSYQPWRSSLSNQLILYLVKKLYQYPVDGFQPSLPWCSVQRMTSVHSNCWSKSVIWVCLLNYDAQVSLIAAYLYKYLKSFRYICVHAHITCTQHIIPMHKSYYQHAHHSLDIMRGKDSQSTSSNYRNRFLWHYWYEK